MEVRDANIIFNKSGGTSVGGITHRITLPKQWLVDMGITEKNRSTLLEYDEIKKIIKIIKK